MNCIYNLSIFCLYSISGQILAELLIPEFKLLVKDPQEYGYALEDEFKDTNRTQRDVFTCDVDSTAQLTKIDIASESSDYSRLCDNKRNVTQFRLGINVTTNGKNRPILTILNVLQFYEQRSNGSVNVTAIGYVESGVESIQGFSFLLVYDVPNLNPGACYSIEGLTTQSGSAELIFSRIDSRRIDKLYERYTTHQLVSIFKKYSISDCNGGTYITYTPGLIKEHVLDDIYPVSNVEKRKTTGRVEQILDECELLSANIVRIEETAEYTTDDSCDAVDVYDRYEDDTSTFDVYIGANTTANSAQARILYSNGFRNKGSIYGLAIGIVVRGPNLLLGAAYLEIIDLKNFHPYGCQSEPGITQLRGSTEKIIANLDVQNLLAVMDLESVLVKIRSNRIVDCIGGATVNYSPGLVFGDVIHNQNSGITEPEVQTKPKLKNNFKFNKIKKIFVDKLG